VDGTVYAAAAPAPTGEGLRAGDDAANDSARGLLRFPLGAIPPGARIRAARLRLQQSVVVGAPFATLGVVRVEAVDAGPGLDPGDHGSAPFPGVAAVVSQDPSIGPREVDVTLALLDAWQALRPELDLRLRFDVATDNDGLVDRVAFNDAEDSLGSPGTEPLLEVVYEP
jgi:hypothetical protein